MQRGSVARSAGVRKVDRRGRMRRSWRVAGRSVERRIFMLGVTRNSVSADGN